MLFVKLGNFFVLATVPLGDLHPSKPCLWRDGSAEQGGVVAIEGLEGGVVGREVTRTWFPARNKSQELQQFRLYFTGSSGILKEVEHDSRLSGITGK